jgi:hypothetical protein
MDSLVKLYLERADNELILARANFELSTNIEIKKLVAICDWFWILDNQVYHFRASLKDLGRKWFAFSKFDTEALSILDKLK